MASAGVSYALTIDSSAIELINLFSMVMYNLFKPTSDIVSFIFFEDE
jgi:hypothetical protein